MDIYKLCVIGNHNRVKEIIIFGQELTGNMNTIFSEKENDFIEREKPTIRYSKQQIHKDDSIRIIKNKILKEYDFIFSYEELYLFSTVDKSYSLEDIFEQVSKKKDFIEKSVFKQLLINLGIQYDDKYENKQRFFYEDLYQLYEKQELHIYPFSIGKKYRLQHNPLFCPNPFLVDSSSPALETNSANPFESFENQVLLNNHRGNFVENTIFLCLPEDVFDYIEEYGLEFRREELISYYFPLLSINSIDTKTTLLENRNSLIKKTKKDIHKKAFDIYKSIDLLYDIYKNREVELQYVDKGISNFYITLHPEFKTLLPLDTIFKSVHATKDIPFIKYNPGFRRENIYRLYTEQITKYGTKIPFLTPKTIFRLMKETGKGKQISFAIENEIGDIYIDFNSNGSIQISGAKFKEPLSLTQIDSLIQQTVNPILENINEFLEKSGYKITSFTSIREPNVEILQLSYVCSLKITKDIDITKYKGLFGILFDIIEYDIHKGALFRFKRVENYQEMNAEDIFISELHGKYQTNIEISHAIAREYDMTEENAILRLTQFIKDHERGMNGQFVNQSIRVLESPGFLTEMRIQSYDDLFQTEIILDNSTIHPNIEYLDVLMVYIDSLLRITQDLKSTGVSKAELTSMLNKSEKIEKNIDKSQFDNVIRASGATISEPMMFSEDMIEEDLSEEEEDIDGVNKSFGNLNEYQTVDIPEEEIENIDADDFMFAEYQEDSSPESIKGGENSNEDENITKNIDGMQLRNRNSNIFLTRLKKYDPVLFLDKDDGKFNSYSKLCASNRSRQPVVISDEEKRRIDEKYPGGYKHAIQYGTTKKNWYICPRYWCLLNNAPLSEEDVKNGACGGKIIPKNEEKVPKGHYIYEFNHHIQHQKNGKYIENSPGFLDESSHPNGYCIPCCFKKEWSKMQENHKKCGIPLDEIQQNALNAKEMKIKMKNKTTEEIEDKSSNEDSPVSLIELEDDESHDDDEEESIKITKKQKQTDYIYEIRRYPIPQERMGFLPVSVEAFLQTDNSISLDPNNNKFIKQGSNTLLRYGVENSSKKSFIACLADLYKNTKQIEKTPQIEEMCKIIASAVSIDYFLTYHNGSLPAIFKPKQYDLEDIDYTKYENTTFMKSIKLSIQEQEDFMNDTIASYENFIKYILDPESYIDHTYLWDIVCIPNPKLFINGYNLAILKIREVDMTDDIELLCPTNAYSSTLYDKKKETLILIQHDVYYEPVYFVEFTMYNEIKYTHTFFESNKTVKAVHDVLKIIRNSIQKYCSPQDSIPVHPTVYKFKRNHFANDLKIILLKYKYNIEKQVINYQGKVIALFISSSNIPYLYIPCAPSGILPDLQTIYMDDDSLWHTYKNTRNFLLEVMHTTKGEVFCKPVMKIIEDEMIIGLLTETNQFLMISEPEYDTLDDGIISIKDENYIIADRILSHDKGQDKKRIETVQRISLETQFYKTFRSTVRILLNEISHKHLKTEIMDIIDNIRILYKEKLSSVIQKIKELCKGYVDFRMFDPLVLMKLKDIVTCFSMSSKVEKSYCILQENGEYQMILPEKHLVSGVPNEKLYFSRMADELIRYKRIQQFMLHPKTYLNISDIEYQLNDNEMIILESLLTSEYFKQLEPYYTVGNSRITYEIANPLKSQKYANDISIDTQKELLEEQEKTFNDEFEIECIQEKRDIIGNISSSIWKQIFPKTAKEIVLNKTIKCSYYPILYIFKNVYGKPITIENIKRELLDRYNYYIKLGFYDKILSILRKQGKKEIIDNIRENKYTLQDIIISEGYFITNLDLWIISISLKLPIILFSSLKLKSFFESEKWLYLYKPNNQKSWYYIRSPTEQDNVGNYLPQYHIITPELKISIPNESSINSISIEVYLEK